MTRPIKLTRRAVLALLALAAGCGVLQPACQPAAAPSACDTSDLDSAYWDAVIAACYEIEAARQRCPAAQEIFEAYQAAVAVRCGKAAVESVR